jgi:hypothetical protein
MPSPTPIYLIHAANDEVGRQAYKSLRALDPRARALCSIGGAIQAIERITPRARAAWVSFVPSRPRRQRVRR